MKVGRGSDVCYNAQTVVDSLHKLIIEVEVTNEPTDHRQLSRMAVRAKQTLEIEQLEAVADRGYYDGAEVKKCKELAERPFGTMKRGMNSGYFLMREIKKVAAEMSLIVMAYNIKRVINILGVRKMLEAVG